MTGLHFGDGVYSDDGDFDGLFPWMLVVIMNLRRDLGEASDD